MKYKTGYIAIIILICFSKIFAQAEVDYQLPEVSIISMSARFVEERTIKHQNKAIPGKRIGLPVVWYETKILYTFKFSVKFHRIGYNKDVPLDVQLISPDNQIKVMRLPDSIGEYSTDKFYDFEFIVNLKETGWYIFNLGIFPEVDEDSEYVFDYRKIYVNK